MNEIELSSPNRQVSPNYLKAIFQMLMSLSFGLFAFLMWQIQSTDEFFSHIDISANPGIQLAFILFLVASLITMIQAIRTGYKASSK